MDGSSQDLELSRDRLPKAEKARILTELRDHYRDWIPRGWKPWHADFKERMKRELTKRLRGLE